MTGVQTCALPIYECDGRHFAGAKLRIRRPVCDAEQGRQFACAFLAARRALVRTGFARGHCFCIGRATAVSALTALRLRQHRVEFGNEIGVSHVGQAGRRAAILAAGAAGAGLTPGGAHVRTRA